MNYGLTCLDEHRRLLYLCLSTRLMRNRPVGQHLDLQWMGRGLHYSRNADCHHQCQSRFSAWGTHKVCSSAKSHRMVGTYWIEVPVYEGIICFICHQYSTIGWPYLRFAYLLAVSRDTWGHTMMLLTIRCFRWYCQLRSTFLLNSSKRTMERYDWWSYLSTSSWARSGRVMRVASDFR